MSLDDIDASQCRIRIARRDELARLQDLEREATRRFLELPETRNLPDDVTPVEELEEACAKGLIWVADPGDRPIGFAYATPLDGHLHLEEISVSEKYGRLGLGRRLINAVLDRARVDGLSGVTLTTFRDVPWNAPYYGKLGFRVLTPGEISPGLGKAIEAEARRGLPTEMRVAMVFRF